VKQAITIYEPRCAANGVTIEANLDSVKHGVLRRGEMMQVISNVIANSLYAMPSGGTLSLATHDVEDGVALTISDTGVGIAPQDLPKAFDAFFTTRSSIGTGIGLFVAKEFVEGHGGHIELESQQASQQSGTTVKIFLPLRTSYDQNA
jgi:signal transduction histidine kinase